MKPLPGILLVLCIILPATAEDGAGRIVNEGVPQLPALPSFDVHPDGSRTFVWSGYEKHLEWMWSTSLVAGERTGPMILSPGGGIQSQPRFVATGNGRGWGVWTRQRDGHWEVVARRMVRGSWQPLEIVTDEEDAMLPAAVSSGTNLFVAYEDHATSERIALRRWSGGWSSAVPVSDGPGRAYRPVLAAAPSGEVWVFWDSYLQPENSYAVFGRRVAPSAGPVERLSPVGRNCLKAAAVYTEQSGFAVAWVNTEDAQGGEGVLDHLDTIQVATRKAGGWHVSPQAEVPLMFGLTSRMQPAFESVWGYAGRRRHPLLLVHQGGLWFLWERRISSGGSAGEPGRLCARRLHGETWSPPVVLHEGLVEYALPESGRTSQGKLAVIGRDTTHRIHDLTLDLSAGKPITFEPWTGWKPVKLPGRETPARKQVSIGGKAYQLYWGDLHVHSILTPDAEGEVDELMHFARDRSRIDVIVVQENDSNSWSKKAFVDHRLSASEYALSVYYSRRYTEPGRFVALPGFEWSQRTPDDDKPNHRTIMYAGADTPVLRHTENPNFEDLCQVVEAAGGNMFTQHEAFRLTGCGADTNVEVATGWGIYINNPEKIHSELSNGHRIGFVGTSDGHRRNPGTGGGLTAIFADKLTPEAVLEALKQRRVYATNGSRIFMDARANGSFMGEDVTSNGPVALTVEIAAPRPIERLVLIRDGVEAIAEAAGGVLTMRKEFTDHPAAGRHWYYWRVELSGEDHLYRGNTKPAEGRYAWSSPHRVTVRH